MPRKVPPFDLTNLAERYLAGEGLEGLAIKFGISPQTAGSRLQGIGIKLRGRSEAMKFRHKLMGADERKALAMAANKATKGRKVPPEQALRAAQARAQALAKTSFQVGRFERELGQMLKKRGVAFIPQEPLGAYNIDLGFAPIAVEVHVAANNPTSSRVVREKIKGIIKANRIPIYVWITAGHPLRDAAADKIISLLDKAKRNPATVGQCRVIWGTGEDAFVRVYRNEFSPIPPTERIEYVGRFHHNRPWKTPNYVR